MGGGFKGEKELKEKLSFSKCGGYWKENLPNTPLLEKGFKKELRCVMYMNIFPMMNVFIMYCKHILMKNRSCKFSSLVYMKRLG